MAGKAIDLTGKQFGRLAVIERVGTDKNGKATWFCKCECGNSAIVNAHNLRCGDAKSCGCLRKETVAKSREIYHFDGTNIARIRSHNLAKNNTSGVKGISFDKKRQKYVAQIRFRSRGIFLGRYSDINDAISARKEAEEKYFKPAIEAYKSSKEGV